MKIPRALSRFFEAQMKGGGSKVSFLVTYKHRPNQQSGEDLPFRTFERLEAATEFMRKEYKALTGEEPPDEEGPAGAGLYFMCINNHHELLFLALL